MTRIWIMASVVTATSILLAYGGGVSQRGQAGPVSDNLAVEIVGEEGRGTQFRVFDAPEGGSLGTCPATHLSEWKQPDGIPPITCLKLRAQKEDGSVRIKVFAVFDDSLPVDSPGPKYGQSEKLVANYLVREGEIVLVKELAEFGVEPVRLKVVMAAPQPVDPPLAAPGAAISKLDAIEVNAFGFDASDPKWYRLSLRNLTQKNIIALHIYQVDKGGVRVGYQTEMWSGPRRPLIVAGGMFETQVDHGAHRGVMMSQGGMPEPPQSETFVIGTVVFEDGTYEGEARVAAGMEARKIGRKIQLGRVISLLNGMRNRPEQDAQVAVAELKSQVSILRIDVDKSTINELLARYPTLSGEERKRDVIMKVMDGLNYARNEALYAIEEFTQKGTSNTGSSNFSAWLSKTREKYEAITLNR